MKDRETEMKKAFLIGLERLTRETCVIIGGCGCCGSPFLSVADETDNLDSPASGYSAHDLDDDVSWKPDGTNAVKGS